VVKQKLGLATSPLEEDAGTLPLSFWQGCCRKILPTQLSINPLLHGDGVVLTIEDIVPLELVERKQRPQQKDDFSPEHFQVQAPTEYEVPVEHKKFLAQVLETGDSLKNRDRKIAVIGEPGAGKTTLLQEIAKEVEGAGGLPVFVKLADLGEKTLKDYLLENWLEEATGKRRISEDIQDDFVQQFNLGRVWLLLDGVDEIAGSSVSVGARHVVPLQMIASQLKGWVSEARIVLTCRLNVWDVGKNDLYAFEKYRIQQLSYPDMVDKFIRRFFFKAGEPTKGEKLIEKLERSQPRIRDLVKNPLRLTLLCRIWKRRQGELPQTKAELYKGFVETFYDWKDKPEIDQEKRPLLEQALGELAKNAIDKETTKFRLRESFVPQELGKFDKSLFDLACRVSWINNVGVAAENPDEAVYAFFHPTFQEYFAALAIADWDFFLPRAHDNHNPKPVSERYRIFEPQWKEVILLWLGRPHEEVAKEQKEEFIQALVGFEDGCGENNFYGYRAYFLAAAGIAEFKGCSIGDEVVAQIIKFRYGCLDGVEQSQWLRKGWITEGEEQEKWIIFDDFISRAASVVLRQTGYERAIELLNQLIGVCPILSIRLEMAKALYNITPNNLIVIEIIIELVKTYVNDVDLFKDEEDEIFLFNEPYWIELEETLKQVAFGNKEAIKTLSFFLIASKLEGRQYYFSRALLMIDNSNSNAIATLSKLLKTSHNKQLIRNIADTLGLASSYNQEVINVLLELLNTIESDFIRLNAAKSLGQVYPRHPKAISTLSNIVLKASQEDNYDLEVDYNYLYFEASEILGRIDPENPMAFSEPIILEMPNLSRKKTTAIAVSELKKCLLELAETAENGQIELDCYEQLWDCTENITYPAFCQAWHQQEEVEKTTTTDR